MDYKEEVHKLIDQLSDHEMKTIIQIMRQMIESQDEAGDIPKRMPRYDLNEEHVQQHIRDLKEDPTFF